MDMARTHAATMAIALSTRTAFISDAHLGTRGCRALELLGFLDRLQAETLYLVGDIVDFESLRRRHYWPRSHAQVIEKLRAITRRGTRVIMVPGNHDAEWRRFAGGQLDGIEVKREATCELANGRRMLVVHGDEFDREVSIDPRLERLGDALYGLTLSVDRACHAVRSAAGLPYWSLAANLKMRFAAARRYVDRFERIASGFAVTRGYDGIVCGHIHRGAVREVPGGLLYANDGDWVDGCTALIEQPQGSLRLIEASGYGLQRDAAAIQAPLESAPSRMKAA